MSADDFMEATLDVWKISPESARRVQHPAPFPVELPRRLIDLYTYEGDAVLDPFLGSGHLVAAARTAGAASSSTSPRVLPDRRRATRRRTGAPGPNVEVLGEDPLFETDDDEDRQEFSKPAYQSKGGRHANRCWSMPVSRCLRRGQDPEGRCPVQPGCRCRRRSVLR